MPRKGSQALAHTLYQGVSDMKPQKTVFMHDGQTKVTLIGTWFSMTAEEIAKDYANRLEQGDPLCRNINDALLEAQECLT